MFSIINVKKIQKNKHKYLSIPKHFCDHLEKENSPLNKIAKVTHLWIFLHIRQAWTMFSDLLKNLNTEKNKHTNKFLSQYIEKTSLILNSKDKKKKRYKYMSSSKNIQET